MARLRISRSFVALAALAVLLPLTGCSSERTRSSRLAAPTTDRAVAGAALRSAVLAQELATPGLLARADVAGTGATLGDDGAPEVVVLLERAPRAPLPATLGGVRVRALVTGPLRAWALTDPWRPLAIGVSLGNAAECLPGTLGCVLERGSRRFVLSANHVLARQNHAALGEPIVQPSRPDLDPGCAAPPASAVIATLADFQPVVYDGRTPNTMDAAIAEITLPSSQVGCATPPGFYGLPGAGTAAPAVGLAVLKLGRTTALTRAPIKAVNVKTKLTFPSGTALFVNQVLTGPGFGDFGDSGALVVTDDAAHRPVGMVIGGGHNGAAIVTPIGPVLARFGATVCTH